MEHPEETVEGVKNKLIIALFALCFIAVVALCAKAISAPEEVKTADKYFICNCKRLADECFILVYSKNGETYYPDFTNMTQVYSYINHLETLGNVNRNGYEIGDYLEP